MSNDIQVISRLLPNADLCPLVSAAEQATPLPTNLSTLTFFFSLIFAFSILIRLSCLLFLFPNLGVGSVLFHNRQSQLTTAKHQLAYALKTSLQCFDSSHSRQTTAGHSFLF